ncbi:MAG: DUF4446 family protein [Clostridiales bacterium]|nr:DUF4446 family protein [Clostridiales bacterium]
MEMFYQIVDKYLLEILLGLFALALISLIIVCINFYRTSKIMKKYNKMMQGMDNKNLESMLLSHLARVDNLNSKVEDLDYSLNQISGELENCLQNAALVRYNPFNQMGGDQSFSAALLDKKGDGLVLTGLYSRESSSIFAKPIVNTQSKYPLSNEEKRAIELALKESKV